MFIFILFKFQVSFTHIHTLMMKATMQKNIIEKYDIVFF